MQNILYPDSHQCAEDSTCRPWLVFASVTLPGAVNLRAPVLKAKLSPG